MVELIGEPPTHQHITTVNAGAVLAALPEAELIGATDDGPIVRVPHTQRVCEVLASLSVPCLPPIVTDYGWRAELFIPFPHQFRIAGAMSINKRFYCLADPATGKTASSIWALDYLLKCNLIKRVLIVCPMSLMRTTWLKEFNNIAPDISVSVLHGDAAKRRRLAHGTETVHIINYDGVEIVSEILLANKYDLVIFDESTFVKNINRRWKFCNAIAEKAERAWALTGTPVAQAATDAYGQLRLISQQKFKHTYESWQNATMLKDGPFRWIPRKEAVQLIQDTMQPAIYVRKKDVLAFLPELTKSRREVEMTADQLRMLKELKKQARTLAEGGSQVTAVHGAALRLKLIQVASGAVYDDEHNVVELDAGPRIREVIDIINQARAMDDGTGPPNNKVLVFCSFKHTAQVLTNALTKKKIRVAMVTGDTSSVNRERVFKYFNTTRDVEVIVAVPDVMAHGLTLTAASTTVWFTPHDSAEKFIQANNRMDRPGQQNPMEIIELYGCYAEEVMYNRLDERDETQKDILSAYSELVRAL